MTKENDRLSEDRDIDRQEQPAEGQMPQPLSLDEVREMLDAGVEGHARLVEEVQSEYPADLADLVERMDEDERRVFFGLLPVEIASETLAETSEDNQEELIRNLDDQALQELFEELSDDDATDIVQELSEKEAARVLSVIDKEDREDIQTLMTYADDTAGGVMTGELVSVDTGTTAAEAIEQVRIQGREIQFFTVYVVDSDNKLCGTLSTTELILADPRVRIADIMDTDIVSVPPEMDQEQVAHLLSRYNQVSIAVVDNQGRLLGRVTVDDVIDILEEEATEDIFRMSGVNEDESVDKLGVFQSIRYRLPWLVLNLFFTFISANIIKLFIGVLEREVVLAMFLPVVAGIGGNTSTQSLAVTLRRLILHEMEGRKRVVIFSEAAVALLNGLVISLLIALVVWVTESNMELALIVGAAAWIAMTVAGILGAVWPILLRSLGFDPAVSSTFITNITDIISFFLILGLSSLLLLG
jgi:magnesium transporter